VSNNNNNNNNLESLEVQENRFTGDIPELSALQSLTYLDMSTNLLSGEIPDLQPLTQLETLNLADNNLVVSYKENLVVDEKNIFKKIAKMLFFYSLNQFFCLSLFSASLSLSLSLSLILSLCLTLFRD